MKSYSEVMGAELLAEYSECDCLIENQINCLKAHDVTAAAMIALEGPRWGNVRFDGERFEVDPEGEGAFILPCCRDGLLHDLVAWTPSKTATRLRRESILNFGVLSTWHDHLVPLRVHRTVLGWLQSECHGVVILEPDSAWDILWRFEHFIVDDIEHGIELEELFHVPIRKIDIQIPVQELAA